MKATYIVERVTYDPSHVSIGIVYIIDENTETSIANNAESIVADVLSKYPNYRIIYRNTDGTRDELLHRHGEFTGFKMFSRAWQFPKMR